MGLGAIIITFSPNTTIRSTDMNANFSNINNTSTLSIPFLTFMSDTNQIQSDGNGNLVWGGGIGKTSFNDVYDSSTGTVVINEATSPGAINFMIGGVDIMIFNQVGPNFPSGTKLTFTTGSISRLSSFTGAATGTFNHNNGGVPDTFAPVGWNSSPLTPVHTGYSSVTSTQVHISLDANWSFICHVAAF